MTLFGRLGSKKLEARLLKNRLGSNSAQKNPAFSIITAVSLENRVVVSDKNGRFLMRLAWQKLVMFWTRMDIFL